MAYVHIPIYNNMTGDNDCFRGLPFPFCKSTRPKVGNVDRITSNSGMVICYSIQCLLLPFNCPLIAKWAKVSTLKSDLHSAAPWRPSCGVTSPYGTSMLQLALSNYWECTIAYITSVWASNSKEGRTVWHLPSPLLYDAMPCHAMPCCRPQAGDYRQLRSATYILWTFQSLAMNLITTLFRKIWGGQLPHWWSPVSCSAPSHMASSPLIGLFLQVGGEVEWKGTRNRFLERWSTVFVPCHNYSFPTQISLWWLTQVRCWHRQSGFLEDSRASVRCRLTMPTKRVLHIHHAAHCTKLT